MMVNIGWADPIPLNTGTAAQSSTLSSFTANLALDTVNNFTHTTSSDNDATWQVLLPEYYSFNEVVAFNRNSCCQSRLRDITIEIVDFSGDVNTDFTGGTVTFTSELLNPENTLGSPGSLTVNTEGAVGNMIRISRTPDPDLSGSNGVGNQDESSVLSLNQVTADGVLGGPLSTEINITSFNLDSSTGMVSMIWSSNPNRSYSVVYGLNLVEFPNNVSASVQSGGDSTTFMFVHPAPDEPKLFFRIVENPTGN